MSVLVTGGAGFIGSHMVLALLDAGEKVVVIDDLSTGKRNAVPQSAKLVVGDVGDAALVEKVLREHDIEAVTHFAAKVVVPDSVADPLGYYQANTAKTIVLLAAVVRADIKRFVFSSTAAVYGNPDTNPVEEDARLKPESPYGTSKLMSEWILRDTAAAHGLSAVVLRYFNVAGADPGGRAGQSTPDATHLIKVACEAAVGKRKGMQIFGTDYATPDGTCVRDYIHVSDLINAHVAALRHLRKGGENLTLNCGYGRGYSVREVVDAVKRVSGVDFPVTLSPRRPGDAEAVVARADRVRAKLGWQPKFDDLTTIVTHALAWERKLVR